MFFSEIIAATSNWLSANISNNWDLAHFQVDLRTHWMHALGTLGTLDILQENPEEDIFSSINAHQEILNHEYVTLF